MSDDAPQDAVILFADLVGSSRLSDVLKPGEYDAVVSDFQKRASDVLATVKLSSVHLAHWDASLRGDEVVAIVVCTQHPASLSAIANAAIRLAVNLNVAWFLSATNRERIEVGATPFRMGIGIHRGPVMLKKHMRGKVVDKHWVAKPIRSPEGLAINFAKRVESASREGVSTGIVVSQSFHSACKRAGLPLLIREPLEVETKGFEQREPIYEIDAQDVVVYHPGLLKQQELLDKAFNRDPDRTRWLVDLALETHFRRADYNTAISLGERAVLVTPRSELLLRLGRSYSRRADIARRVEDIESAIRCFRRALALGQDRYEARFNLAHSFYREACLKRRRGENFKECLRMAEHEASHAIEQEPTHFYGHYLRAEVLTARAMWTNDSSTETLQEVDALLEAAKVYNSQFIHHYALLKARLALLRDNLDDAKKHINDAKYHFRAISTDASAEGEPAFPDSHFRQPGFALHTLTPTRLRSFAKRLAELLEDYRNANEATLIKR